VRGESLCEVQPPHPRPSPPRVQVEEQVLPPWHPPPPPGPRPPPPPPPPPRPPPLGPPTPPPPSPPPPPLSPTRLAIRISSARKTSLTAKPAAANPRYCLSAPRWRVRKGIRRAGSGTATARSFWPIRAVMSSSESYSDTGSRLRSQQLRGGIPLPSIQRAMACAA